MSEHTNHDIVCEDGYFPECVWCTFSNDTYLKLTSLNHINEINVDNFLL